VVRGGKTDAEHSGRLARVHKEGTQKSGCLLGVVGHQGRGSTLVRKTGEEEREYRASSRGVGARSRLDNSREVIS